MQAPKLTAYLSGSEDSLADYPIPISYVSLSLVSGVPSYYSITAPMSPGIVDAFELRPNGKIYILRDGVAWEHFNQGSFSYAVGPRSSSITASGERQTTNAAPATHSIPPAIVSDEGKTFAGNLQLTVPPFALPVKAGDFATWGAATYTVARVAYTIGVDSMTCKLTLEP